MRHKGCTDITLTSFRHFGDMFIVLGFVREAWQELVLIGMLTGILITMFGSMIYFAELPAVGSGIDHPPVYSIAEVVESPFWVNYL